MENSKYGRRLTILGRIRKIPNSDRMAVVKKYYKDINFRNFIKANNLEDLEAILIGIGSTVD